MKFCTHPHGPARLMRVLVPAVLMGWGITSLVFSQWTNDRNTNTPVCTVSGDQMYSSIISDNAGGAIIVWHDYRNGNADVYAQRLDAKGAALWPENGVAVCLAPANQEGITIAGDGSGGALIAWMDRRNDFGDIYAQRVNAHGQMLWAANGVAAAAAPSSQQAPRIVGDGAGGAVIAWLDWRFYEISQTDIYAQRLNASGVPQWTANGVAVCSVPGYQWPPPSQIALHEGGVIIVWDDGRDGQNTMHVYAQRLDANGNPQWAAGGIRIGMAPGNQWSSSIISDGTGGAIIMWAGTLDYESTKFAQRLDAAGAAQWDSNGVVLRDPSPTFGMWEDLISDGAGGGIVVWDIDSNGQNLLEAQRVDAAGQVLWGATGVRVSTSPYQQYDPAMVSDGAGGAIITWREERGERDYIFAQHLDAQGQRLWTDAGLTLTTATGKQEWQRAISDGAGGAIAVWHDERNGGSDIYAQRIGGRGDLVPKPAILAVTDVPHDQGGRVLVRWQAADLDVAGNEAVQYYSVWRSVYAPYQPSYWEWIASQPRHNFPVYALAVPTLFDSSGATKGRHDFLVSTHTNDPGLFWDSEPMSGYSVDNLAPAAPGGVIASMSGNNVFVHWNANHEQDFACYEVYRSTVPNFDPAALQPLAIRTDTSYVDVAPPANTNLYYAILALDVHGNRSAKSNEAVVTPVSVSENASWPSRFVLEPVYPNPFCAGEAAGHAGSDIRFQLPHASQVTVKIFNTLGEEIRTLAQARFDAGHHRVHWDGNDGTGKPVASGVYLYQLRAGEFSQVRKMSLVR